MKKFLFTMALISLFSLPVSAVCSITGGACRFDSSPSYSEYSPNSLDSIEKYNIDNSISPNIRKNNLNEKQNAIYQTDDYDASCQFGMCLPKNDLK